MRVAVVMRPSVVDDVDDPIGRVMVVRVVTTSASVTSAVRVGVVCGMALEQSLSNATGDRSGRVNKNTRWLGVRAHTHRSPHLMGNDGMKSKCIFRAHFCCVLTAAQGRSEIRSRRTGSKVLLSR